MDTAGYNKEKINAIGDVINQTYSSLVASLGTKIEEGLVRPMSTKWYAPEAVEEFENIKEAVATMGENMYDAYSAYRDWVQQMGETWVQNTGGSMGNIFSSGDKPSLASVNKKSIDIDVSAIKEKDDAGNVILDEKGANTVAQSMKSLHTEMLALVKAEHGKLEASSAFIGHGQAAAATACFVRVADAIGQLFKLIDELGERLKQYADKYKQVAEGIKEQFNSAKVEVKEG